MAARPAEIDYVPVPLPSSHRPQPSQRRLRRPARRMPTRASHGAALSPNQVQPLALRSPLPAGLRSLMMLQRSSSVLMVGLGVATLMVYGGTVHSQRAWSEAYSKLAQLRRNEPQLTLANEALKQHSADDAERQDSGLVDPSPSNALFLEPAPPRPTQPASPMPLEPSDLGREFPVSY